MTSSMGHSVLLIALTSLFFVGESASAGIDGPDLSTLSEEDLKTVTIHLERTGCFGSCPSYALTIHGDGNVEYEGKTYVKETGSRAGHMDATSIRTLLAEFNKTQFWELDEDFNGSKCKVTCTDMATVRIRLDVKGIEHHVVHYYGCGGVPRSLFDLESAIERQRIPSSGPAM